MFSLNHIIWIIICIILCILGSIWVKKTNPEFKKVINYALILSIISEVAKVFSVVKLVPVANSNNYFPYIELNHLPLHLCSLQIVFFIFLKMSNKDNKLRPWIISFMYPSCILGGIFAILLPTIFNTTITVNQAFTHPISYQTFLYHTMLIIYGYFLFQSKEINLEKDGIKKSIIMIILLGTVFVYLNSAFTIPIYESGALTGVSHNTNFFFVSLPPIPITLTKSWHWLLYLCILLSLAVLLINLLYLPIVKRKRNV